MKITRITEQVKTKGRYSIYIDEKFAFGISELGLINNGLRIGQKLTRSELNDLAEKAEFDKHYNMTINLIARRPRSIWEVDAYLKRKQIDEPSRKALLQDLEDRNYLNDLAFTESWVENRRLLKTISFRKLRIELMQKHVSSQIIDQVLQRDDTNERDVLKQEIIKRQKMSRYQDPTKLMQYLARQGYQYNDIKDVLTDLDSTN